MEFRKEKKFRVKPLFETPLTEEKQRLAHGCTNLMYACQQGLNDSVVKELRSKPNIVHRRDRSNKSALHYCSGQRDLVAAASVAVAAPELLGSADEDGFTPLHLAVIQGNMSLVSLLLANKADVNALDNEGHSVVHWATVCGEVEALRAVLQAGANVSNPDINGGSPLHYAAQMCGANYEGKSTQASSKLALEILNILLAHQGTSVDVIDRDGRQPLLWAASAGSAKAILALVKAGARVESCDKDGLTALHCAASRGHTECLDTLINLCGAPTDLIDSNGCTALHYAVTLGHADATSLLLNLEADPNRQDRKGRTPSHCGCAKGQFETVRILGAKGANLWLRNAKGDLPVHEAAASGRKELVLWLLEQRPNQINVASNDGRTLLHIAASYENIDMCKMLLDLGADVNSITRTSHNTIQTPLDCALQKGHRSIAKYLQAIGGLPANKIRLSARRQINKTEPVKPLKFAEKEELLDLKSSKHSKRYVVYVKRTDSEDSVCNVVDEKDRKGRDKSRKSKCKCRHHRRAASSCSETFKVQRDESEGEMCRSKSNLEISRRHKSSSHHHQAKYTSSSSTSGDECECYVECARGSKKNLHKYHKCCDVEHHHGTRRRSKSCDKYHFYDDDKKTTTSTGNGKHKKGKKLCSKESTDQTDDTELQMAKHKIDEYKKALEELEQHKQSLVLARSKTTIIKEQESKNGGGDETTGAKQQGGAPRPSSAKKRPQSARASSAQRRRQLQQQSAEEGGGQSSGVERQGSNGTQEKSESTNGNDNQQNKIVTEAQVHAEANSSRYLMAQSDDRTRESDIPSDATFIVEKSRSEQKAIVVLDGPGKTKSPSSSKQATPQTSKDSNEENQKRVNFERVETQKRSSEERDRREDEKYYQQQEQSLSSQGGRQIENESEVEKSKSFTLLESDQLTEQEDDNGGGVKAVIPLPDSENDENAKSSFTILDDNDPPLRPRTSSLSQQQQQQLQNQQQLPPTTPSRQQQQQKQQQENEKYLDDESSEIERKDDEGATTTATEDNLNEKQVSSFTVIEEEVEEEGEETSSSTTGQQQQKQQPANNIQGARGTTGTAVVRRISDDDDTTNFVDDGGGVVVDGGKAIQFVEPIVSNRNVSADRNGKRKKLKKRTRNSKSIGSRSDDDEDGSDKIGDAVSEQQQQQSKDQDSGFEPSPRAMKGKIPISPKGSYGGATKRLAFTTLDDEQLPVIGGRVEGRKPGDQNACNMTTVSYSLQKNIRRYYMERKIFQHLLELKSLQIRSNKTNESLLVKRAVDDYHKSVLALGLETGSTLKRYPHHEYTFKNFEVFLYETLKNLQKSGTYNFQNISEVYKEAERRLSPEYQSRYERALNCTTKTHRCLHAVHAYTGIPCAAYIPMINHHTIPKLGFGSYKTTGVGSFYLPKILTRNPKAGSKVSLELSHGNNKQLIPLPYDKLDKNKKYYVTFSVKGNGQLNAYDDKPTDDSESK